MSAGGDLGGLNRFAAGHAWAPYALLTLAMLLYGSFFVVGRAVYAEFPPVALSFWRSFSLATIGGLIYLVVFAGIIALVLVNVGIARLGPSRAGAFFYLMPVFTALIAVLGLGEVLRFYHVAGLALVIGGIVFVGRTTDEPVSRSRSD